MRKIVSQIYSEVQNSLSENLRLSPLRTLHWVAEPIFRGAGFRFEVRRNGDLKLGLWRKTFRPARRGKGQKLKRIVWVPGFGDTPLSWFFVTMMLMPFLSRQYDEVVLVDFPGFQGFLAREKSFHSIDLLFETLFDAFDSLRPHTIVGHSLGGWLTAHYSALCGEGARPKGKTDRYLGPETILLVNSFGVFPSDEVRAEWETTFKKIVESGVEGYSLLRPHVFAKEPVWFKLFATDFYRFVSSEEIHQLIHSFRDEHLLTPKLSGIRAQTWLLWGEKDSLTPASAIPVWMRGLSGVRGTAKAVVLKNLGHSPQIENGPLTAAVIGQILNRPESARLDYRVGRRFWQVIA